MLARHRTTGKEYAVKVLDKGHLKRNNKLPTALAEKNTLVRLGVGHPGIVHLHSTFQDEWSLCESMATCLEGEITRQALQKEGPRFLFKGWTPAFIRLGPNTVLMFVFYEVRIVLHRCI